MTSPTWSEWLSGNSASVAAFNTHHPRSSFIETPREVVGYGPNASDAITERRTPGKLQRKEKRRRCVGITPRKQNKKERLTC